MRKEDPPKMAGPSKRHKYQRWSRTTLPEPFSIRMWFNVPESSFLSGIRICKEVGVYTFRFPEKWLGLGITVVVQRYAKRGCSLPRFEF